MKNKILNKTLTVVTFVIGLVYFYQSKGKDQVSIELQKQMTVNSGLYDNIKKYLEREISNENFKTKFLSKTEHISDLNYQTQMRIKLMQDKINRIKNDPNTTNESILSDLANDLKAVNTEYSKGNSQWEELHQMLIDDISGNDNSPMPHDIIDIGFGREIFNNISSLISSYTEYLETLNTVQLGALSNILLTFLILSSLISLFIIFFSDYFIKRLDLTNYPRIKKFLDLRRKFQVYYFIFNALMIFVSGLALLFVNISLFLNY